MNFSQLKIHIINNNQTDKAREQKLRLKAAVIGKLKRTYEC